MRSRSMKIKLVIVTLTVMLLTQSACKSGDGNNQVVIPQVTSAPTVDAFTDTELRGELLLPIPENADRKNPYSVTTEEMRSMFSLVFEPLISVDDTGKLIPALAQSWVRTEGYDSTWTLSLRQNVTWHNGAAFTASDVTYSFNYIKNYLSSENASTYYKEMLLGVESMSVVDDMTVKVKMSQSGYSALYGLNFPIIQNKNSPSASTENPVDHAVGTGAYKVDTDMQDSVTLSVNQNWWRTLPRIKTIKFMEKLNNDTALASYEAGQLNFVPTSNLSAGKYRKEGETIVLDVMTQDVEILLFNYDNPLLYDMNIRKAIAHSIDRSKLITNVYMNRAQACDVPVAPDSWLYSSKSKTVEFNTEYACTLLENAGYKDSDGDGIREKDGNPSNTLTFRLLVNASTDNTARKNAADTICAQLKECGIAVQVIAKEYSLTQSESEYINALKNGDFDLALTGVSLPQSGDLTEFFKADGSLNFGGITDETLVASVSGILSAHDESTMRDNAAVFQTAFVEKLPFLVLYFRLNSIVYTNDLQGLTSVREPNIMYSVDSWYVS